VYACVQAGRGYLSAVPLGEFSQLCEGNLPTAMMGADFLHQYGNHYDQQTQVSMSSFLILLCCVDIRALNEQVNWYKSGVIGCLHSWNFLFCYEQSCM